MQRSANMAAIRGKDTAPEICVRSAAHRLGYRFRLHQRDLPGRPDLVFPRLKKAILVHGCYWHRHAGCKFAYAPKSNTEFWMRKFADNVARDRRTLTALEGLGWDSLVVWECETGDLVRLAQQLSLYLSGYRKQ
jgi:DNA mismatch endonuclease (patch repair protein)